MENAVDVIRLAEVTTATATHLLFKLGVRNVFLEGVRPLGGTESVVGTARTLQYLPMREDLWPDPDNPSGNPQRIAIETINTGEILVIDARGDTGGGALGDILCERMKYRGAAGVIVDGVVRDAMQIQDVGLPVWGKGVHGAANSRTLWPVEYDVPVSCGGCTVIPGDYIIADGDGVVVIPAIYAGQIAEQGAETEQREQFIRMKIRSEGYSTDHAYPPNDDVLAEYEAWKMTDGGNY